VAPSSTTPPTAGFRPTIHRVTPVPSPSLPRPICKPSLSRPSSNAASLLPHNSIFPINPPPSPRPLRCPRLRLGRFRPATRPFIFVATQPRKVNSSLPTHSPRPDRRPARPSPSRRSRQHQEGNSIYRLSGAGLTSRTHRLTHLASFNGRIPDVCVLFLSLRQS